MLPGQERNALDSDSPEEDPTEVHPQQNSSPNMVMQNQVEPQEGAQPILEEAISHQSSQQQDINQTRIDHEVYEGEASHEEDKALTPKRGGYQKALTSSECC